MPKYEVEVKTLLGEEKHAVDLKERMQTLDPACALVSRSKQLNHYFEGGDMDALVRDVSPHLTDERLKKLSHIVTVGSDFSVRTRQKEEEVLLVVKASVDQGTSANSVSRLEFEERIDLSLADLDKILLGCGFKYQAKWSREREEYSYKGLNVCIDKNAGYGYLAEFEKMTEAEFTLEAVRAEIQSVMDELDIKELPQERLERMFAHYNQNWPEYYGTDKVFVVE